MMAGSSGRRVAAALIGLVVCIGCGGGTYAGRMDEYLKTVGDRAALDGKLYGPSDIGSSGAKIRIPNRFKASYAAGSGYEGDPGGVIAPARLHPSVFLPEGLPGHVTTWEALETPADGGGVQVPVYMYLATVKAADIPQGSSLEQMLSAKVLATTEAKLTWEDRQFPAHGGGTVVVRAASLSGKSEFASGPGQFQPASGRLDLFVKEGNGTYVIIGFRAPDVVVATIDQLSQDSMGSLTGP